MIKIRKFEESVNVSFSNYLCEDYNINYYGKDDWARFIKFYIKEIVETILPKLTKKEPKSIMIHKSIKKDVWERGFVVVNSKSMLDHIFKVNVSKYYTLAELAEILIHELVHVKQVLEDELKVLGKGRWYWKGEVYSYKEEYRDDENVMFIDYEDAPWEIEARDFADDYYRQWKKGSERREVVVKLEKWLDSIGIEFSGEDIIEGTSLDKINPVLLDFESKEALMKLKRRGLGGRV